MLINAATLASAGLLVSAYGYFIEKQIEKNPTYKPICDISEKISCSKPFLSPYGKVMNISNTVFGIIFYTTLLVFSVLEYKMFLFYLSIIAVAVSVYLAYILYFKIRSFCLLCSAIYGINLGLLLVSYSYIR